MGAVIKSNEHILDYLHQREVLRFEEIHARVTATHKQDGGWGRLLTNPNAWFELVNLPSWSETQAPTGSPPFSLKGIDVSGLGLRIALLDEQKRFLIGIPTFTPRAQFRPIVSGKRTVGWLVLVPLDQIDDVPDHCSDERHVVQQIIEGRVPGLVLDEHGHRIALHDQWIELTRIEFHLLYTLVRAPGRVFTRDQLLDSLYGGDCALVDRTIDSHVRNLRRKLEHALPGCELVKSVYGVGYKFEPAHI